MNAVGPGVAGGFRHRIADHAASGALRDLLEHHRASYAPEPLSEGAVFGFSGAFHLTVRMAQGSVPAIDFDGRALSLELDACRHLGLDAEWHVTDDPRAGAERLRSELDDGYPVVLRADVGELDYHDAMPHDTRHAIVVTCCDMQAGVAWVTDRFFADPQRCTLASLAAARASRGWPEPARHGLLSVRRPARLAAPKAAIHAALARAVANMRDPQSDGHPHVRNGLAALDGLVDAWPRLPELADGRLGQTLAALRFRIRDGGTGGALYRSLQARFEHDAAALLGSLELGRAALACDELTDAWRALAVALEDGDADRAHAAAQPWLARVHSLEHRHVEAVELALGTPRAVAA